RYLPGKEVEVDVIGDGDDCLIPGIMEHIERAGVHSGDSMAVFPPQTLSQRVVDQIVDYAVRVARALKIVGLMNIQFVVEDAPVFSFAKLTQVDVGLGPEMKSTGEIMGTDLDYPRALYKAMLASGVDVPVGGVMIATIANPDKDESLPIIRAFRELGFEIYAT